VARKIVAANVVDCVARKSKRTITSQFVARMERSEIRERPVHTAQLPGLRFTPFGYKLAAHLDRFLQQERMQSDARRAISRWGIMFRNSNASSQLT
jgi:hypothetical protein